MKNKNTIKNYGLYREDFIYIYIIAFSLVSIIYNAHSECVELTMQYAHTFICILIIKYI